MSILPVLQLGVGLPYINRPLDNTALSAYMTCPREYYFSMVLHRRHEGRSPALAYGTFWHKILEWHYKSDGDPNAVRLMVEGSWEDHGAVDDYRTEARAWLDYEKYLKTWGQRPSKESEVKTVGWPDEPMVEIAADVQAEGLLHPYAVKIDRVVESGGLHFVMDHKTTSRLDKNYYSSFELSNQMMGYTYIAQALMPSLRIAGVIINVAHILKTGTNFERQFFTFTREQMKEWVGNTNKWMLKLNEDSRLFPSWDALVEEQDYPIGHYGTNGCDRKYGMCGYAAACRVAAPFRHRVLEEYPVHPWNPLESED